MASKDKRIKAVFFDIDGTLISFRTHRMHQSTQKALHALREKGMRVFVATGRSKMMMPFMDRYFSFDAYLTLNGQYCYDRTEVIRKKTVDSGDILRLKDMLTEKPFPCLFVEEDGMFMNFADERVKKLCELIDHPMPPSYGLDRIRENDVLQFVPFLNEKEEKILTATLLNVESTRSVPYCFDVMPAGGGKDAGMEAVLAREGIAPDETMAFGDGFNDIGMLGYAGIGVAMGNAADAVKASADHVTSSVEEGGIASALQHFGILD